MSRGASAEHCWSIVGASTEHARSMQGAYFGGMQSRASSRGETPHGLWSVVGILGYGQDVEVLLAFLDEDVFVVE